MTCIPKVGDKARIRSDLVTGETFGSVKMLSAMEDMKGKTGKVTAINEQERAVKVGDWWYSYKMVSFDRADFNSLWWFVSKKVNEADAALESIKRVLADFTDEV